MLNFQMDNVLNLHGLIGGSKHTGGNTKLGLFQSNRNDSGVPKHVIKSFIDDSKHNMAIGKNGIIYYDFTTPAVYWLKFGSSTPVRINEIKDFDWSFDPCQMYPTVNGFLGIYKDDSSSKETASYTMIEYTDNGELSKIHHYSIPQDANGSSGAYINKVVQDPITEQFVFLFQSYATDAMYLLVMDKTLTYKIKNTFVEKQYSINTKFAEYMAYDGWLYGRNKANNSLYCKMKYNTSDDVTQSFASFSTREPQTVVCDPQKNTAFDISDGNIFNLSSMSRLQIAPKLHFKSSGDENPVCMNFTPNPQNGLIIAGKNWDLFEITFRVPNLGGRSYVYPSVRLMTEVASAYNWDGSRPIISYDSKTMLMIYYDSDRNGVTSSNSYVFRR
ncbi:hypothetical protein FDC51_15655 [Clostridium botulinum]|nr:hypothetical protein [Clostridium botulinum]